MSFTSQNVRVHIVHIADFNPDTRKARVREATVTARATRAALHPPADAVGLDVWNDILTHARRLRWDADAPIVYRHGNVVYGPDRDQVRRTAIGVLRSQAEFARIDYDIALERVRIAEALFAADATAKEAP